MRASRGILKLVRLGEEALAEDRGEALQEGGVDRVADEGGPSEGVGPASPCGAALPTPIAGPRSDRAESFEFCQSFKTETKGKSHTTGNKSNWCSEDNLLESFGYNENTKDKMQHAQRPQEQQTVRTAGMGARAARLVEGVAAKIPGSKDPTDQLEDKLRGELRGAEDLLQGGKLSGNK